MPKECWLVDEQASLALAIQQLISSPLDPFSLSLILTFQLSLFIDFVVAALLLIVSPDDKGYLVNDLISNLVRLSFKHK